MPPYTRNFGRFVLKLAVGVLEVLREGYLPSIKDFTLLRDTSYALVPLRKTDVVNRSNFDDLKVRKN